MVVSTLQKPRAEGPGRAKNNPFISLQKAQPARAGPALVAL